MVYPGGSDAWIQYIDGGAGYDTANLAEAMGGISLGWDYPGEYNIGGPSDTKYISIEKFIGTGARDVLLMGGADQVQYIVEAGDGNDHIEPSRGSWTIYAGNGNDEIYGKTGDTVFGGAGNDTIVINSAYNAVPGYEPSLLVQDFVQGSDGFNLFYADAKASQSGNQAYAFIGTSAFSGAEGELRYENVDLPGTANDKTIIQAESDNNHSGLEMEIVLAGLHTLQASDFVL